MKTQQLIYRAGLYLRLSKDDENIFDIFRSCDKFSIPLATNLATAEMLIKSLANGDLAWREMYRSDNI